MDFGPEIGQKTIFSGIKEWYTPEELVGVKTMGCELGAQEDPIWGVVVCCLRAIRRVGNRFIVRISDDVEIGSEFH